MHSPQLNLPFANLAILNFEMVCTIKIKETPFSTEEGDSWFNHWKELKIWEAEEKNLELNSRMIMGFKNLAIRRDSWKNCKTRLRVLLSQDEDFFNYFGWPMLRVGWVAREKAEKVLKRIKVRGWRNTRDCHMFFYFLS